MWQRRTFLIELCSTAPYSSYLLLASVIYASRNVCRGKARDDGLVWLDDWQQNQICLSLYIGAQLLSPGEGCLEECTMA